MKIPREVLIAIAISALIRIIILTQTQSVTYESFLDLTHIQHIADTGLLRASDADVWMGAIYSLQQLYHYLAAFLSLMMPIPIAALLVSNIASLSIPLLVFLLAQEITSYKQAARKIAIASAFIPLLYAETTISTSPLTLAIPLLLASYYYFIRLAKTPKDQYLFILYTSALALTHPISLLLPVAMIATLALLKIQQIKFSRSVAESTIFATFLLAWANLLLNNQLLEAHGLQAIIQPSTSLTLTQATTAIGAIIFLASAYAIKQYLTEEKDQSAHALIALAITGLLATILRVIKQETGLLLVSITLTILAAKTVQHYYSQKHTSRVPWLYTSAATMILALFVVTNAIPATALGVQTLQHTLTQEEQELLLQLQELPTQKTYIQNYQLADALRYYQQPTITSLKLYTSPNTKQIQQQLAQLESTNNPVTYIDILNQLEIQRVVITPPTPTTITQRCFEQQDIQTTYEVYDLRCIVN